LLGVLNSSIRPHCLLFPGKRQWDNGGTGDAAIVFAQKILDIGKKLTPINQGVIPK